MSDKFVSFSLDTGNVEQIMLELDSKPYKQALNRTMNRVGDKAKTQLVKEAASNYNMKSSEIKAFMTVKRSKYGQYRYYISIDSKRRNIIRFMKGSVNISRKKSSAGVFVKIKKSGGFKPIKDAFVGNDGRTVFKRVEGTQMSGTKRTKWSHNKDGSVRKREQIKALRTISVPQMFRDESIDKVNGTVRESFGKEFEHNLNYYLKT